MVGAFLMWANTGTCSGTNSPALLMCIDDSYHRAVPKAEDDVPNALVPFYMHRFKALDIYCQQAIPTSIRHDYVHAYHSKCFGLLVLFRFLLLSFVSPSQRLLELFPLRLELFLFLHFHHDRDEPEKGSTRRYSHVRSKDTVNLLGVAPQCTPIDRQHKPCAENKHEDDVNV